MLTFVSYASKAFLSRFKVLYESIKQFHPESPIILWTHEAFDVPPVNEWHKLPIENVAKDKAYMCLDALSRYDKVVFVGADTELFRPIDESPLDKLNFLIVPHICRPLPDDGLYPSEGSIIVSGLCNADFFMFRKDPETITALEWLKARCRDKCRIDPMNGLFNEQGWLSLMPHLFKGMAYYRDMTLNVAYWNAHLYNLRKENGGYVTDGGPLTLFHYSGFDPEHPENMSIHQNRHVATDDILELYQNYADRIKAN